MSISSWEIRLRELGAIGREEPFACDTLNDGETLVPMRCDDITGGGSVFAVVREEGIFVVIGNGRGLLAVGAIGGGNDCWNEPAGWDKGFVQPNGSSGCWKEPAGWDIGIVEPICTEESGTIGWEEDTAKFICDEGCGSSWLGVEG